MFLDKNVVLINDTSADYHWGCFGTSNYIKSEILKRNPKCLETIPVWDIHGARNVPQAVEEFDTLFLEFEKENKHIVDKISKSDSVIINGEGTIHGFHNAPRALLYIAYIAKCYYHKTVFIINHSCFPKTEATNVESFYKLCYGCCDYIAVREQASYNLLVRWGLKPKLAFDCLPLSIQKTQSTIIPYKSDRQYVCLSGGVNFRYSKAKYIAKYLKFFFRKHEFIFLTGSPDPQKDDGDKNVYEKLKKYIPSLSLVYAETFEEWLGVIQYCDFLLSGRFHYTVAKMAFSRNSVIAFESNTPKVSQALKMFKLPEALPYKGYLFRLIFRLFCMRYLRFNKSKNGLLHEMCVYAENNYKWEEEG